MGNYKVINEVNFISNAPRVLQILTTVIASNDVMTNPLIVIVDIARIKKINRLQCNDKSIASKMSNTFHRIPTCIRRYDKPPNRL